MAALVSQGLGVSIVPACLVRSGIAGTRFIAFAHAARWVSQAIWASPSDSPYLSRAVAQVRQQFEQTISASLGISTWPVW